MLQGQGTRAATPPQIKHLLSQFNANTSCSFVVKA